MRVPSSARVLVLALLAPLFLACGSPAVAPPARAAETDPSTRSTPGAPGRDYTLVLIRTGPRSGQLTAEENQRAFQGHFDNMQRMAEAGQLVLAGPYGERRSAPDLRGIFVLGTKTRTEAEAWAGTD